MGTPMWMVLALLLVGGAWAYVDHPIPPKNTIVNTEFSWVYQDPSAKGNGMLSDDGLRYTHMGMLAVLPNGSIAATWQGSVDFFEGSAHQSIYWSVSDDGGRRWGPARRVVPPRDELPVWGPVLHVQDGRVFLFYSASLPQCNWWGEGGEHWSPGGDILLTASGDNGETWSEPRVIHAFSVAGGIPKMTANGLALDSAGTWLLPFWQECGPEACCVHELHGVPGVLVSSDQGETWGVRAEVQRDPNSRSTWLIENTIAPAGLPPPPPDAKKKQNGTARGPPELLQLFRTGAGAVFASRSADDGASWTPAVPIDLPNPDSKVDLIALPSGELLLAYNNSPNKRRPLQVALSRDGGRSWGTVAANVEDDPVGTFHYPTLLYLPKQDRVLIIYTVDFPPHAGNMTAPLHQPSATSGTTTSHSRRLLNSPDARKEAGHERLAEWQARFGFSGSLKDGEQPPHVGAWGQINYGIRVASMSAYDLRLYREV